MHDLIKHYMQKFSKKKHYMQINQKYINNEEMTWEKLKRTH